MHLVVVVEDDPRAWPGRYLLPLLQQEPTNQQNAEVAPDELDTAEPCILEASRRVQTYHIIARGGRDGGREGEREGRQQMSSDEGNAFRTSVHFMGGRKKRRRATNPARGFGEAHTPRQSATLSPGLQHFDQAVEMWQSNNGRGGASARSHAPSADPSSRSSGTVICTCRRLTWWSLIPDLLHLPTYRQSSRSVRNIGKRADTRRYERKGASIQKVSSSGVG